MVRRQTPPKWPTMAALVGVLLIAVVAIAVTMIGPPPPETRDPAPVAGTEPDPPLDTGALPIPSGDDSDYGVTMQSFYQVERVVVCPVEPVELDTVGAVSMGDEPADRLDTVIRGGEIFFRVFEAQGTGWVLVPGYQPVRIGWAEARRGQYGRCTTGPVVMQEGRAVIRGRVTNAALHEDAWTTVRGCGTWTIVRPDATFEMEVVPGDCTVRAVRLDGRLPVESEPVSVSPAIDKVVDVSLDLPGWRVGGLGVAFERHERGVEVVRVVSGSAAAAAGLLPGDVVIEIAGVKLEGMALLDVRDLAIGREGTEAEMVVLRGTERRSLSLERGFLPAEAVTLP